MLYDAYTVAWKEVKTFGQGGSRGRLWALIFPAVFGIIMPLQMGEVWLETPAGVIFWVIVPLILVASWVADAFAGEKERHTLETLLASRLSDRAILLGKVGATIAYAWGTSVLIFLVGMITANVVNWSGTFRFYSPEITLAGLGFSLLVAGLAATAGTLIALRASSVRQAQQIVSLSVFALVWIPIIGLNLASQYLPEGWLTGMVEGNEVNWTAIILGVLAFLAVVDVALFAASLARFQRTKLVLD
ncbi:MAG: hypothetical protein ACYC1C_13280 [Chloroflexota bacterium]